MTVNRARRSRKKWSEALFRRIIARIEKGTHTADAIRLEGIHHSTFYSNLTPANSATLKAAQLHGPVHQAETELYRRGVKGYLKPVFQGGREVGRIREYDTTALIVYLKGNCPERYRENQVTVANSVQVNQIDLRAVLDQPTDSERAAVEFFRGRCQGAIAQASVSGDTFPDGEVFVK